MTHKETVNSETFARLQAWQRHLVLKHDPLLMPGDTLVINEQDTRNQLELEIKSIEPLHSRSDLVGLYGAYSSVDDVPESVGGGGTRSNFGGGVPE